MRRERNRRKEWNVLKMMILEKGGCLSILDVFIVIAPPLNCVRKGAEGADFHRLGITNINSFPLSSLYFFFFLINLSLHDAHK